MIEPLSLDITNNYSRVNNSIKVGALPGNTEKAQEFLTIFYKEMLKQSIKLPGMSVDGSEDESGFASLTEMNSDLLIEKFAKQLAKSQAAQLGWINDQQD